MPERLVQVIVLTEDLEREGDRYRDAGFRVEAGGRHPGRGTENLIVPFAGQYLEILAVVDPAQAADSPQGRPVMAALARRGPGLARWSLESDDMVATASRLGLPVEPRHRERPDGKLIRWRAVGVNEAWEEPWRCAYMAWDDLSMHPGAGAGPHPNGAVRLGTLRVAVPDMQAAHRWIGPGGLPPGVDLTAADSTDMDLLLTIPLPGGDIVVGPSGWAH
jgi:hypothetical protein